MPFTNNISFPPVNYTNEDGILAVGGNLEVSTLLEAYSNGIFPWFNDEDPILWWCPDPRFVLHPQKIKISKSMRQLFKQQVFSVTFNQEFEQVISACKKIKRKKQESTWITEDMKQAYVDLHQAGYAHSIEVWQNDVLVGGLYGVQIKGVFSGESMFSLVSNASKYGFIHFARQAEERGIRLIDCQVHTPHLESLGAEHIRRDEFIAYLK